MYLLCEINLLTTSTPCSAPGPYSVDFPRYSAGYTDRQGAVYVTYRAGVGATVPDGSQRKICNVSLSEHLPETEQKAH